MGRRGMTGLGVSRLRVSRLRVSRLRVSRLRVSRLPVVQRRLCSGRDYARRRRQSGAASTAPHLVRLMRLSGVPGPGSACRRNGGGCLGGNGLRPGCWRGFVRRVSTLQPIPLRPPADAVGLRLLDARGVARNTYAHRQGELEALFVG